MQVLTRAEEIIAMADLSSLKLYKAGYGCSTCLSLVDGTFLSQREC